MALFSTIGANTIVARLPEHANAFAQAAAKYGVAVELLYALAAHESSMRASAVGAQNANGTRDYGLMQVNNINYDGNPNDLLTDVGLNVDIGAKVIADAITRAGGDVLWAISGYNRGFRDTYNGIALTNGRIAATGQFPNQSYVEDIVAWVRYFRQSAGKPTDVTTENLTEAGFGNPLSIALLAGILVGMLFLRGNTW